MKIIRNLKSLDKCKRGCAVTIGNFDGLHLGHQQILSTMQEEGNNQGLKKLIIFTEPHAQEFFAEAVGLDSEQPPRIFPWQEKLRRMNEQGVDFAFFL